MADIFVPDSEDDVPADAFDPNAPLFNPQTTGPVPDQADPFGGKIERPNTGASQNFYLAQDDLSRRAAKAIEDGDMQKAARIRAVAEHFSTSRYQAEQELDYRENVIKRENAQKILAQTPGTAQWLAANPLDAPIFQNDLGALAEIEKIFEPVSIQPKIETNVKDDRFREYRQITGDYEADPESSTGDPELDAKINTIRLPSEIAKEEISRGFEAGKATSERGLLYYGLLNGTADNTSEEFMQYDAELERRIKAATDGGTDGFLYNAAQFVGSMAGSAPGGVNEAAGAGVAALGVGLMTQGAGLTATGVGAIPGITMSALGGLMTGALWFSASQKVEAGLELQTLLSQGADPDTARFIAHTVGGINGLIEVGLTAVGAKAAAPVLKVIANAATAKTVAALAEPSVRHTVLKGLQAYGVGVAGEALTEVMQEAVSAYGEEAGRILANSDADPLELNDLADRLADTAVNTLKGAALLGAGPAGMSTLTAVTRVSIQQGNAQATKAWAERLNETMPQVQAKEAAPSAVHEFVQAQADKSGLNNIYIDADTFKQVASAAGITDEELQQTLPAVMDQLKNTDGQSRDITIPVADYATQIAGTPLGEQLTEHIRRNADDLSFAETKRANELTREFLTRLSTDPEAAEREITKAETEQGKTDRRAFQDARKAGYVEAGWNAQQASMAAQYEGLVLANLAQRTGLPFRTLEARAPKINLTTADGQTVTLGEPAAIQQAEESISSAVDSSSPAGDLYQASAPEEHLPAPAEGQRVPFGKPVADFIGKSAKRRKAIDDLQRLMSTEYQQNIVLEARGRSQLKYQKIINDRVQKAAAKAGVDLEDAESPVVRELLVNTVVNDALYATSTNKSAIGWYDEKVRQMLGFAGTMFPELDPSNKEYDPNASFVFLYVLATTSNGLKVKENLPLAVKIYREYKRTGEIPGWGQGTQSEPMIKTLKDFAKTAGTFGTIDEMRKFFMTTWTVKQLELMGYSIAGEGKSEETRGAAIIGPKIGNGFFANLNGLFDALTMDRWFMRTYGRWQGSLIDYNSENFIAKVNAFRDVLNDVKDNKEFVAWLKEYGNFDVKAALRIKTSAEQMDKVERSLDAVSSPFVTMAKKAGTTFMPAKFRAEYGKLWGTQAKSIGWRFYSAMKGVERAAAKDKVAPAGSTERAYIRSIFREALDQVHKYEGLERLTMADLQAALWYAEKKIYENTKSEGDFVKDYSEEEAPDYANVMRDVALKAGIPREKLDEVEKRIAKEIENETASARRGEPVRARYDTLNPKERVAVFGTRSFSTLRRMQRLSLEDRKKQGQRGASVYRDGREVAVAGVRAGLGVQGSGSSGLDEGGDRRRGGKVQPVRLEPIATWSPGTALTTTLKANQEIKGRDQSSAAPSYEEFAPTVEAAEQFREALIAAKKTLGPAGACVEEKSIEELTGQDEWKSQCRIFLAPDRKSGFVIKNGDDLVSVFSAKGSNSGDAIVECAVSAGARRLDCFNTILPKFYATHGFRPVARLKFSREYAPYDWDYDFYKKYNKGEPDVIFMVYDNGREARYDENKELDNLPYTDGEHYGEPYMSEGVAKYAEANKVVEEAVQEAREKDAAKKSGAKKGSSVFQQSQEEIRGGFSPSTNTITLNRNSDLSTVAHELGHWYLETLFDLSKVEGVDATITEDTQALLKEFGFESVDAWQAAPLDARRKAHEQFAHWTEIYLATGKAPVPTLKRFFLRFGAMIRAVYESIREGTNGMTAERIRANYEAQMGEALPEMPEEVRRALDRMLASQQALAQAETADGLQPLFEEKPLDMSDDEWREMQRERDDAFNEGTEAITAAQAKDEKWLTGARSRILKDIQKKGEEARKKIRQEVETEVNSIPGVVALDLISAGSRSAVTMNLRLREDEVKALGYSDRSIAKLKARGIFQKRNAVPLAYAREMLKPFARFNSDKKMIDAMLAGLDAKDGIEKEVDRRMLAQHSDLVTPEGQAKLLTQALHNEARARLVATELRYLMQGQNVPSRVLVAAARKAAEERLSKMKIRDLSVKQILGWEARASRKAFDALQADDRLGAVMAKREQLVWHEAVSMALDIDQELQGLHALRSKIFNSDKELAKSRDTGYIAVARYVLTNVGLGQGRAADLDPSKAQSFVEKLRSYDPEKYNTFSGILMRFAYRPGASFRDMTLIDARDAMDAVRMLWKQAGDERKLDLGERKADLDEVVGELVDAAAAHGSGKVPEGTFKRQTLKEAFYAKLRTEKLKLLRVENWCVRMDSGDADGPFQSYIYRPMAEAAARYRDANIQYQKKLADLIRPMVDGWQKFGAIEAPELRYTFSSKAELIGMLLHTGNASNKEKLLLGGRGKDNVWADQLLDESGNVIGIDTSRFDAFIARCYSEGIITIEDMDFVQAVWDLLEELKPLSQKAYNRMYGYYFEEVEAEPVLTPWGIYRGGYVPAKADRTLLAEQTRYEEQDFMLNASSFASAMPVRKPGFTMSRVDVHNPLDFDLSRLCSHLSQSLKFAYMGPTAIQVAKILNDKRFASAVDQVNKGVDMALLRPWLDRTYQQRVSEPSDSWIGRKLNSLRGLAGMNVMALNFNNTLQQITGFSVAAAEVPAKELAHALSLYFKGPKKLVEDMCAASVFMKTRLEDRAIEYQSEIETAATMDVEGVVKAKGVVGKALAANAKLEPVRQWAARHAYVLQRIVQNNMDTVIWTAARNHGEAIGTANPEAYADSVVRRTQSDFAPENIAGIEASGPLMRFVLVFYNYFGMQYNLLGDKWAAAKATKQYGRFALDAALIAWIPAVLSELIARALTGEGLDVDDDDDMDAWDSLSLLLGPLLKNFISMIPVAGGILNIGGATAAQDEKTGALSTAAQFVYGSDPYVGKMLSTPALQLIGSSGSTFLDAARALNGEEVNARSATRNFLDLTTLLTGVPTGPLKKPLGYAAGVASGQIQPDNAADYAAGLYVGRAIE